MSAVSFNEFSRRMFVHMSYIKDGEWLGESWDIKENGITAQGSIVNSERSEDVDIDVMVRGFNSIMVDSVRCSIISSMRAILKPIHSYSKSGDVVSVRIAASDEYDILVVISKE